MRFVMKLDLAPLELEELQDIDKNCARHISVVNDICSWDKELRKSLDSSSEVSVLCSSVKVIMDECSVDVPASKRPLWTLCRGWELEPLALAEKRRDCRKEVLAYLP